MPAEDIYRRQVADRAGAPLPSSSPEQFGAGLGRAVEQAAGQAHVRSIQAYQASRQIDENRQWSQFQVDFVTMREEQAAEEREGRKSDVPGHADRIAKSWQERQDKLLSTLTYDGLRERAEASMATWGGGLRDSAADWETLRQSKITVENAGISIDASANRARRLERPEDFQAELSIQYDAIDGLNVSDESPGCLDPAKSPA